MTTRLSLQTPDGTVIEIGPEHPDYARLLEQYRNAHPEPAVSRWRVFGVGALLFASGTGTFGINWMAMRQEHGYYVKLEVIGAMAVVMGMLCMIIAVMMPRYPRTPSRRIPSAISPRAGFGVAAFVAIGGGGYLRWWLHQLLMEQAGL